ncbi:hypothetical protein [Sphingomonas sp.]|uniref:hypothetical protein n=1 Tax=Sphingomonas sp. TaxID=28214 RepID=UPI003B00935A
MFGPRLFRSRWSALFWAAGVVWFAYDVADDAPHGHSHGTTQAADATGDAVTAADLAAIANAQVN